MSMKNQFTEHCTSMLCSEYMSVWGLSLREAVMKKKIKIKIKKKIKMKKKTKMASDSGEKCSRVVDRLEIFAYTAALIAGLMLTGLVLWMCVGVCGGVCGVCMIYLYLWNLLFYVLSSGQNIIFALYWWLFTCIISSIIEVIVLVMHWRCTGDALQMQLF